MTRNASRFIRNALLIGAMAMVPGGALMAAPDTRPATTSAPARASEGQTLRATITGVEGIVQVREDEDRPWVAARKGMVVGEGAEFRTGPRSAVQFSIPPDQTITLDRLGIVKLVQAV